MQGKAPRHTQSHKSLTKWYVAGIKNGEHVPIFPKNDNYQSPANLQKRQIYDGFQGAWPLGIVWDKAPKELCTHRARQSPGKSPKKTHHADFFGFIQFLARIKATGEIIATQAKMNHISCGFWVTPSVNSGMKEAMAWPA